MKTKNFRVFYRKEYFVEKTGWTHLLTAKCKNLQLKMF